MRSRLICLSVVFVCASAVMAQTPKAPGTATTSVAMALDQSVVATGLASAAADFNGDGKMDLATLDTKSGGLTIRLGKGNGSFYPPVTYHAGYYFNALVVGDFNGDGKLDVAVSLPYLCPGCGGYPSYLLMVFLGAGDGTFNDLIIPKNRVNGLPLAAGDFNGDGKLDLIVTTTDYYGDSWPAQIMTGNGDGTFKPGAELVDTFALTYPAVGDLNGDGKLDIVLPAYDYCCGSGLPITYVFLGNGNGTFSTPVQYPSATENIAAMAALADVNGDGKLDIITDGIQVLLNNGDGTFTNDTNLNLPASNYAGGVAVGDFNGDGKMDFAAGGSSSSPFSSLIFLGNNDGTFQSVTVEGSYVLQAADFNGDGKLDLLTYAGIYLQTPASISPTYLNFGDVNINSKSASQTATLTNVGTKTFPIESVAVTGTGAQEFTIVSQCGRSLAPGKSCQVQLVFAPTAGGNVQPSLTFTVPGAPPAAVILFGAAF